MKEFEILKTLQKVINSAFIGDDCAYLEDLGIVVTQDSLVENLHFKLNFTTPYQLGFKSVMVNLSDVYASGALAKYITISLSLPKYLDNKFVEEFYKGAKKACGDDVQIIGGDITSSEKLFISICAIGTTKNRKISSRKNAKVGYKIITKGFAGSSSAGLKLLLDGVKTPEIFIKSHLEPIAQKDFSTSIASKISEDYAMMDTSDGLMDGLFKIAEASNALMSVDFDKIPYDKNIEQFENYKDLILFGAEDYNLVAVVPEDFLTNLSDYTLIGEVKPKYDENFVEIIYPDEKELFNKKRIEQNLFDHFN